VVCHKYITALKTIVNISRNKCKKPILDNSNFFQDFKNFILGKLNQGFKIYLYGHSFGGSICNVIAEQLYHKQLFIRTFGSIYISNNQEYNENTENYMFKEDVSWQKLSGKCIEESSNRIKFVPLPSNFCSNTSSSEEMVSQTPCKKSRLNPFGSADEWKIHINGYNFVEQHIIPEDMKNLTMITK